MKEATGLDGISPRFLKDGASVIAPTVTFLVNLSLSTGIVPCDWKMARVVPLYKSGGHASMDNYRPISILPVMSKIMEKAVNVQLQRYLQRFDLLSPFQAGFRQHHSTESALFHRWDKKKCRVGKVNRRFVYWSKEGLWFCTAQGTLIEIERIWLWRKFD